MLWDNGFILLEKIPARIEKHGATHHSGWCHEVDTIFQGGKKYISCARKAKFSVIGMPISEAWLEKDKADVEFHVSKAQCYGWQFTDFQCLWAHNCWKLLISRENLFKCPLLNSLNRWHYKTKEIPKGNNKY